jgi:tetratricopeptide (TPR) repeat protein
MSTHAHSNHPLALVVFLSVGLGGLGYLAVTSKARGDARFAADVNRAIDMARHGGDLESAVAALEKLAEKRPHVGEVWLNLGVGLAGLGRLDEAEAALLKARAARPDDWDVVAELAGLEAMRGKPDRALELLESIPPKAGQMLERLDTADQRWMEIVLTPRYSALREKHGLPKLEFVPEPPSEAPADGVPEGAEGAAPTDGAAPRAP